MYSQLTAMGLPLIAVLHSSLSNLLATFIRSSVFGRIIRAIKVPIFAVLNFYYEVAQPAY